MRALAAGILVVAAVTLPMAADETPQTGTTTAPVAAPAADQKEDPIICKKLGAPLGSRIGDRKVCQKASAWEAQTRRDQEQMEKTR